MLAAFFWDSLLSFLICLILCFKISRLIFPGYSFFPVVYLSSDITLVGNGTVQSPFIIKD